MRMRDWSSDVCSSDLDHGEVVAGVAGKPAVAAVVAGTGLAGGIQAAKTVADQLVRGAVADRALQRGGDQAHGDRIAWLCGPGRLVEALEHPALAIEHAAHQVQRLELAAGREELVQLRARVRAP